MKLSIIIILILIPKLVFGQVDLIPPTDSAQIFLPTIVSTNDHEHSSPSISILGKTICWSIWERPKPDNPLQLIKVFNYTSADAPITIDFSNKYSDGGPIWLTQDKILFYSKRPIDTINHKDMINDLWISERKDGSWKEPYCLKFSAYTRFAVSPSITNSGTIYFIGHADSVENNMGVYFSKLGELGYKKPVLLPTQINSNFFDWTPFIAEDESYLIFSSNRPESKDNYGDLFISFRDEDDNWTEPISLGDKVNTDKQERFPSVSKDLGILFFTRATDSNYDDVYWIDSKIIEEIRATLK